MPKLNENYLNLKESYLFSEIAHRVNAYVAANPDRKVIRLGIGDVTLPFGSEIITKLHEGVDALASADTFKGYGPEQGYEFLRSAIVDYYSQNNISIDADEVFVSDGAKSDTGNITDLFDRENVTLIPDPVYPVYVDTNIMNGRNITYIDANEENDFLPMPDHSIHADIIYICSPNNPTGAVLSTQTLKQLAALLEERQRQYHHPIYLISDEPYREILYPGADCGYTASLYDNTITCYSFSKSLSLPGERIGYLAVCPKAEEAERIIELCPQISRTIGHNGAATLMQHTVAKCLEETSDLTVYQRNRDRLYQALTEYGYSCVKPDGTFYLFPQSLENDAYAFCARAQELDLLFVPGDVFGCPGHFRIAYCVPEEKVNRALPRLKQLAEIYQRK